MGVYKHNDYYGYINKIQEKAISDPEWFWGDSDDAKTAREWLHNNKASAVIDNIYENTPEDIQKKLSYKKLPTSTAQKKYNKEITDTQQKAAAKVGGGLAASAILVPIALPAMVDSMAATVGGLVLGTAGAIGSNVVSRNLTGQPLDFHMGKLVSRGFDKIAGNVNNKNVAYAPWKGYVVGKDQNDRDVYIAPNQTNLESVGAWVNPVTWVSGAAGAKVGPPIADLTSQAVKTAAKWSLQTVKTGTKKATDFANDMMVKRAVKTGKLRFTEQPTKYIGYHQSETPVYYPDFSKQRWDVVNHNADPSGMFFTLEQPAQEGFLSKRPFTSEWQLSSGKTLIQDGELKGLFGRKNSIRNRVVKYARDNNADAVLFENIADNQLQNQRILFATEKSGFKRLNHNYYNRKTSLKPQDIGNIVTAYDDTALKSSFAKVNSRVPKELTEYARSVVRDDGKIDIERFRDVNEEFYKLFDKINFPYRRMEDVTPQRYFTGKDVSREGNLYDHALGVVESGKKSPLPFSKDKKNPYTRKEMALLDLYHDQGKLVTYINDNVKKSTFPKHDKYGYYMGKLYGLSLRDRNAINAHMMRGQSKNPLISALQSHDRLTGASPKEAPLAKVSKKWTGYKNENYIPSGIYKTNEDLINAANSSLKEINYGVAALSSLRPGFIRNETVARQLQNLDIGNEIAVTAAKLRKENPEAYKQIISNIESPYVFKNLGKTYKILDGNFIDKLNQIIIGRRQFNKTGLPILNNRYYGNIKDFSTLTNADTQGFIPTTRWVAGTDEGKTMLFTGSDNSNAAVSYATKTLKPTRLKKAYSGKITLKEGKLPVSKEIKADLTERYLSFLESKQAIENGTTTNAAKDFINMLKNYSALQYPTLNADLMRGTEAGSYTTLYQKASQKDLVDWAADRIKYSKGSNRISLYDKENANLYKSNPIKTDDGVVYNQMARYFIKNDDNILDIADMPGFGLRKYADLVHRKALLKSLWEKKDKYPTLWNYLNTSGRVSTDGIQQAAMKDNPLVSVRMNVNDFGNRVFNGKYPQEIITSKTNIKTSREIDADLQNTINNLMNKIHLLPVNFDSTHPVFGAMGIYNIGNLWNYSNSASKNTQLLYRKVGGKIHIKEENKGKFTRSAKAAGESVQEHARKVLNDPNATALQKKRANFARNAAKWHK